jgi:hypothetical protein
LFTNGGTAGSSNIKQHGMVFANACSALCTLQLLQEAIAVGLIGGSKIAS